MSFRAAWLLPTCLIAAVLSTSIIIDPMLAAGEKSEDTEASHWSFRPPVRHDLPAVKNAAWMRNAMQALARVLPSAKHYTLAGQTHMVSAKALAPVLAEFFGG